MLDMHNYEGDSFFLSPDHPDLQYTGRIDWDYPEKPLWVYPATSVRFRFRGTYLKVLLTNLPGYWKHDMGYLLDGKEGIIPLQEETVQEYLVARDLTDTWHEFLLFKRMDSCHMVYLHGFVLNLGAKIEAPLEKCTRRIEVYGDSVSAGEVSEAIAYCGQADPQHQGEYSNSYYSYAWITARRLGASLHAIAQGGIALMPGTGWFAGPNFIGMEEIYDKIQCYRDLAQPKYWDYHKYRPHLVMVAIGQNDNHPEDYMASDYDSEKSRLWRERYRQFVGRLRAIYPEAHIILKTTILRHDPSWDKAIEEVACSMKDPKVHYFRYTNNGDGTDGHIRIPEAEKMADELCAFIDSLGPEVWKDETRIGEKHVSR